MVLGWTIVYEDLSHKKVFLKLKSEVIQKQIALVDLANSTDLHIETKRKIYWETVEALQKIGYYFSKYKALPVKKI